MSTRSTGLYCSRTPTRNPLFSLVFTVPVLQQGTLFFHWFLLFLYSNKELSFSTISAGVYLFSPYVNPVLLPHLSVVAVPSFYPPFFTACWFLLFLYPIRDSLSPVGVRQFIFFCHLLQVQDFPCSRLLVFYCSCTPITKGLSFSSWSAAVYFFCHLPQVQDKVPGGHHCSYPLQLPPPWSFPSLHSSPFSSHPSGLTIARFMFTRSTDLISRYPHRKLRLLVLHTSTT